MIKNTFSLLQGIGEKLEKRLWETGILTWDDFLAADAISFMSAEKKMFYDAALAVASNNLIRKNQEFFFKTLKQKDHWRLFPFFKNAAVALDIETNGYPPYAGGHTTVVGLYDGFDYKTLVKGKGLCKEILEQELSGYKYLITFFGSGFDLPFLREEFGINIMLPHFDLCFAGWKAGLKGGLKRVEETLGIKRDDSVKGFDGFDAVRLWIAAQLGSTEAFELLITYNRCDTMNLFELADIVYEKLKIKTGVGKYAGKSDPLNQLANTNI